ncbi:MAG: hypothetical protein Q8O35_14405 [Humidesulfovibrio sp.]|uniref:hypothetical protein n=1 Tax=Humidesulfovibrio sp. TaxID=2910988 RepID=UPI0027359808|nr:hypothetical protein [Humidesulfovibrio sp.]MDP2849361.1 hypothetical protein [Humidesulfovibrio sp.]
MDKEAQDALQKFKTQGLGDQVSLSVTVKAFVFRKWWVDETKPDRIRWFFLDGVSQDAHGKAFWVRAWWPIPLDDLALFEELDQIPLNSILSLNSVSCTLASTEDFYLEDKKIPEQEGNPQFSIELKEPSRR